jgi:dihydroorotate dehydrogenase
MASETGGLSGAPVFDLSNIVIRALKKELGDACRSSAWAASCAGADAKAKIDGRRPAGAAVQRPDLRGPALVRECAAALKG